MESMRYRPSSDDSTFWSGSPLYVGTHTSRMLSNMSCAARSFHGHAMGDSDEITPRSSQGVPLNYSGSLELD